MSKPKPVICIVPEAFFSSTIFAPLITQLWNSGYPTWTADLPTSLGDPSKTAADDITFLETAFTLLVNQGKDLIVLGCGYGAWVGPSACEKLLKKDRQGKEGGGVIGFIYAAAIVPPQNGLTVNEILAAYGNESWFGYQPENKEKLQLEWGPLVTMSNPGPIIPLAGAAYTTPIPYVPIKGTDFILPTAYIHTKKDLFTPSDVQVGVMERYTFQKVIKVDGGHMFMVNHPVIVAEGIDEFVKSMV